MCGWPQRCAAGSSAVPLALSVAAALTSDLCSSQHPCTLPMAHMLLIPPSAPRPAVGSLEEGDGARPQGL
ncbi:unnamed protein product [Gadus morhua 'NCC']